MTQYSRKSLKLKPRHFIHIYSNGYTEINYFNLKKCNCDRSKNIKIEPFFENSGSPRQLIKQIERKYDKGDVTSKDSVFCVMDVDDINTTTIKEAFRLKPGYIKLIFSNPNFELWLLLHFKLYTHQFSKEETVEKLREFIPEYRKPEVAPFYTTLKGKEMTALENAKKLKNYHEAAKKDLLTRETNPYTDIDEVVETINLVTF